MTSSSTVTLRWQGAAHFHIACQGKTIVIDPLYRRLPGAKPRLRATRDSLDHIDYLLLTHGHLDHSWDFPYLAFKHGPEIFAPEACLRDLRPEALRWGRPFDSSRWHSLEEVKSRSFELGGALVTPLQIGTEEIDFWFMKEMALRPLLHRRPAALLPGLRWLLHHLFGSCFAFHFRFPGPGGAAVTLLFLGNLTTQVEELHRFERVDVLALPYCPANDHWLADSLHLISRFEPEVTLVHHFDNFMNPFTLSRYMNLDRYRRAVGERCPEARLFFSKFDQEVALPDILASARRAG